MGDILRHLPSGPLAVVDVLLIKSRGAFVLAMPSLGHVMVFNLIYAMTYVAIIRVNFRITGQWPYSFLGDLGFALFEWIRFAGVQCGILSVFASALWFLAKYFFAFW